jgi:hypothetical protein
MVGVVADSRPCDTLACFQRLILYSAIRSIGTRCGNEISYFEPGSQDLDWDILLCHPVQIPKREVLQSLRK